MKKLFLLFAFCGALGVAANAQCSGAKASSASTDAKPGCCSATAAAKMASLDASIETRTCAETGKVSYMKKAVSAEGTTTFTEVEYCSKSGKFVNVSPSEKAACTKSAKASCTGDAKATKVSNTEAKASCSGAKSASASASCCDKSKSSKASTTTKKASSAKLVSNQE